MAKIDYDNSASNRGSGAKASYSGTTAYDDYLKRLAEQRAAAQRQAMKDQAAASTAASRALDGGAYTPDNSYLQYLAANGSGGQPVTPPTVTPPAGGGTGSGVSPAAAGSGAAAASSGAAQPAQAASSGASGGQFGFSAYDPAKDQAYMSAMSALKAASSNAPSYAGTYDSQLNDLYGKIVGRDKFNYDWNADPMYRQYRDQYVHLGQQAMQDTMGQAAGLTGGYGSSYGQQAGQQAYDAYLRQLNDKMPELYGMARDAYDAEGNQLLQQYGLLGDLRDNEYARYSDDYNRWLTERNNAQDRADTAYAQGVQNWKNNYTVQQDNQQMLLNLMNTGYNPTDSELAFAGLTRAQANTIHDQWVKANTPAAPQYVYVSSKGNDNKSTGNKTTTSTAEKSASSGSNYTYEQVINALMAGGMNSTAAIQTVRNGGMDSALKLLGLK